MQLEHTKDQGIINLFNTPILKIIWPEAEIYNEALENIILNNMNSDLGTNTTNVGGWRSKEDLHTWNNIEINKLLSWIKYELKSFVSTLCNNKYSTNSIEASARSWANVNFKEDYKKVHNHFDAHWAGSYYVTDTNLNSTVSSYNSKDGSIEFLDPRPGANSIRTPGDIFFPPRVKFTPIAGELLIFPAWLFHFVNAHTDALPRISIAFDFWTEIK